MAGPSLTTQELDNIFKTYQHFGAEKLAEFIQAIWTEAYEEGRKAGYTQGGYAALKGTKPAVPTDLWADRY